MKPYKRTKIARTTLYRLEYKVETRNLKDWYSDDHIPRYTVGRLFSYQLRMYKTWKHNRKTQYK
jgi:hypothetical protein